MFVGERVCVEVEVIVDDLKYWDLFCECWVFDNDDIVIEVGVLLCDIWLIVDLKMWLFIVWYCVIFYDI